MNKYKDKLFLLIFTVLLILPVLSFFHAGIPLTHRDFASSVAFVTGHEGKGKDGSSISWKNLVNGILRNFRTYLLNTK